MIVLADNDVILKLARCDLYSEFCAAFDVTPHDIRILNTSRFVLNSNKIRKRCDDASFARMKEFMRSVADIDSTPDPNEIISLAEQPRIDAGEAILFSVCPQLPNSLLATGDKRSLTSLLEAVAGNSVCGSVYARLAGKIVCFEQMLLQILNHCGFDEIRGKLFAGRECDKALAILLGSGLETVEATFREGLISYIEDLRKNSGTLLIA